MPKKLEPERPLTHAEVVDGLRRRLAEAYSYACAARHDPALDAVDSAAWRKYAGRIGDLIQAINEAEDAYKRGKLPPA